MQNLRTLEPMTPKAPDAGVQGKEAFVKEAGAKPKVLKAPIRNRARKGSDATSRVLKLMLYGPWSSGKTYAVKELLDLGYKVLVVTTDLGGDGLLSVELPMRRAGRVDLLDNLVSVVLNSYDEVVEFLNEPARFFPEIYDFDPDIIMWDGFSSFQQLDITQAVGEDAASEAMQFKSAKVIGDQRTKGNALEQKDWGTVRNETLKKIDQFCSLHNKKTGKLWHKIMTCQIDIKSQPNGEGSVLKETMEPFISGGAKKHMAGAFDLIIRTVVKTEKDGDEGVRKYYYVVQPNQNNSTKNRGFDLPATTDASMGKLWRELERQAGIVSGATSMSVVSQVLIAEETGE